MIPVAPFSLLTLLILVLGPLALLCLLLWLLLLIFQPQRRLRFKQKPWRRSVWLAILLALGGAYGVFYLATYRYDQAMRAEQASRRHTLLQASRLAGIAMPAGTRLELNTWGDPDSVAWADFPEPVWLGQAPVVSFERPRPDVSDASWFTRVASDTRIDGWVCSAGETVEIQFDPDDGFALHRCHLAQGQALTAWSPLATGVNVQHAPPMNIELPQGVTVMAVPQGTAYTDGTYDQDRWTVRVEGDGIQVHAWGLELERAYFAVDADRRILYLAHARLASPVELGGHVYRAGTEVATPNYRVHPDWPLALLMREPQSAVDALRAHDLLTGQLLPTLP